MYETALCGSTSLCELIGPLLLLLLVRTRIQNERRCILHGLRIVLSRVVLLLSLYIFVILFLLCLQLGIESLTHLVDAPEDKDTSALGRGLWLANE